MGQRWAPCVALAASLLVSPKDSRAQRSFPLRSLRTARTPRALRAPGSAPAGTGRRGWAYVSFSRELGWAL